MGTAVRMGPAYFPTVLGGILAVIGLAIFAKSFVTNGPPVRGSSCGDDVHHRGHRIVRRVPEAARPHRLRRDPDRPRCARRARVQVEGGRDSLRRPGGLSVAVFVKGLGLPIPTCPLFLDDTCRRIGIGM